MTKEDFGIWFTGIALIVAGIFFLYMDYTMISGNIKDWYMGKGWFISGLASIIGGGSFLHLAFGGKDEN